MELYKTFNGDWNAMQEKAGISPQDFQHFLEYSAQFLGNNGNYKGFGDTKFIPRCHENAFDALASTSPKVSEYYKATKGAIYLSNDSGIMHFGYPEDGTSKLLFSQMPLTTSFNFLVLESTLLTHQRSHEQCTQTF